MEVVTRNASKPGWTPAPEISSVVLMPSHLLTTKFHAPVWRPASVSRPRLVAQLQAGLAEGRKLTLISAPAGYGKTTLAAEWLHTLAGEPPVAWLALDASDDDPARFLGYVLAALQRIYPGLGQGAQSLLGLSQLPPLPMLLDDLLNDLAGLPESVVLALDDYHVIAQPAIHEALSYLVQHQPSQLHLLLITRSDPPLPLPRLRARGQMTEIRGDDLRFTLEEAGQFFAQSIRLALEADTLAALTVRTEGWAAGLQLAGLALQHRPDQQDFIQGFHGSHRYVIDYLAEEVVRQQSEAIRRFLIRTAVLDRFDASLCDAVMEEGEYLYPPAGAVSTHHSPLTHSSFAESPPHLRTSRSAAQAQVFAHSQDILEYLESANLFIIPLDSERRWYRYHHLFADYLRTQTSRADEAALQARAAAWHEAHGLAFEAVRYALASGDCALAADIMARAIQRVSTWSGGDMATLVGWLDALPAPLLRSRPLLSLHASRALYLSGRIALSERLLDQAEQALQAQPLPDNEGQRAWGLVAVYRGAIAALRGELDRAREWIAQAQARLPADDLHAHARAADTLGLIHKLAGDLVAAQAAYLHASGLAETAGVRYLAINAACEAALVQIGLGDLGQAADICQQALRLAEGKRIPPLGLAWAILGEIARERDELAEAERRLTAGIELSRQGGLTDDLHCELLFLAGLEQALGEPDAASAAMAQATVLLQGYGIPRLAALAAAHQARLHLAQGRTRAARHWAELYQARPDIQPTVHSREFEDLTLARVLLTGGDPSQALALLQPHLADAAAAGRVRAQIEALLLAALAQQAAGQQPAAVAALAQAVQLAEPAGFVRLFVEEAAALAPLLPLVRYAAPAFVEDLLARGRDKQRAKPAAAAPHSAGRPWSVGLVEPLSERELEILRLVADGHSNQAIADRLVITVGTAKWHISNIYGKLGVRSRTQALSRARELNLL